METNQQKSAGAAQSFTQSEQNHPRILDDGLGGAIIRVDRELEAYKKRIQKKKPRPRFAKHFVKQVLTDVFVEDSSEEVIVVYILDFLSDDLRSLNGKELYDIQLKETEQSVKPYAKLLSKAYELIYKRDPSRKKGNRKLTVPAPILNGPGGSRKLYFRNASRFCEYLNRPIKHVNEYLGAELATESWIANNATSDKKRQDDPHAGVIILKYRPSAKGQKHVMGVLQKYIKEYVQCKSCHGYSTVMAKDKRFRRNFLVCNKCGAKKFLQATTRGYRGTSRADRIAARQN